MAGVTAVRRVPQAIRQLKRAGAVQGTLELSGRYAAGYGAVCAQRRPPRRSPAFGPSDRTRPRPRGGL